jgi:hypothetical protein
MEANQPDHRDTAWAYVDNTFDAVFVAEFTIRVLGLGRKMLQGEDLFLNAVDGLSICFICFELVMHTWFSSTVRGSSGSTLRLLRLGRVSRVFRFTAAFWALKEFRFFTNMATTTVRLIIAMWTIIAAMTYMTAVPILVAYGSWLEQQTLNPSPDVSEAVLETQQELWGNIGRTMFSLLSCVSGGRAWMPVVDSLYLFGDFYIFIFIVYILFCVYGVFNVAVSVFVHGMTRASLLDTVSVMQCELSSESSAITGAREALLNYSTDGALPWSAFQKAVGDDRFLASQGQRGGGR